MKASYLWTGNCLLGHQTTQGQTLKSGPASIGWRAKMDSPVVSSSTLPGLVLDMFLLKLVIYCDFPIPIHVYFWCRNTWALYIFWLCQRPAWHGLSRVEDFSQESLGHRTLNLKFPATRTWKRWHALRMEIFDTNTERSPKDSNRLKSNKCTDWATPKYLS